MNKPKRQHYIPQMILKGFADGGRRLYCCDRTREKPRIWDTIPKNVFLERYLYTQYDDSGKADESIEGDFSKLEGAVSPIVDKIIDWSLKGLASRLGASEKDLWLRFLVHQRRRTPDVRPLVKENIETLITEIPDAYEAHAGRRLTPEEHARIEQPDFLETAKRNAFPGFAAATPRDDVLKMLRNTSILTLTIKNPKKNFVIGSRPIDGFHEWFPVHQKVAVRLAPPASSDDLTVLDDISEIRRINEGIVKRSNFFAGPSRQLVESLALPR